MDWVYHLEGSPVLLSGHHHRLKCSADYISFSEVLQNFTVEHLGLNTFLNLIMETDEEMNIKIPKQFICDFILKTHSNDNGVFNILLWYFSDDGFLGQLVIFLFYFG